MNAVRWFRQSYFVLGVLASFALVSAARAEEKKGEKQPTQVVIDISKLPPDVQKALIAAIAQGDKKEEKKAPPKLPPGLAKKEEPKAPPKKEEPKAPPKKEEPKTVKGGKSISLTDAIAIAEKLGKGTAVKAELKSEGAEQHFKIDVVGKGGEKQKIELDASGKAQSEGEKKKEEKKGTKKEEDKKDDEKKGKKDDDKDEKGENKNEQKGQQGENKNEQKRKTKDD